MAAKARRSDASGAPIQATCPDCVALWSASGARPAITAAAGTAQARILLRERATVTPCAIRPRTANSCSRQAASITAPYPAQRLRPPVSTASSSSQVAQVIRAQTSAYERPSWA